MSVELKITCDSCRKSLYEDEEIYCAGCYGGLQKEIERLEEELRKVESRLAEEMTRERGRDE